MSPHEDSNRPRRPVHPKVVSATLGASLTPFVVWLTGVVVFGASNAADVVDQAMSAVPWPVAGLELAVLAGFAGWLKKSE